MHEQVKVYHLALETLKDQVSDDKINEQRQKQNESRANKLKSRREERNQMISRAKDLSQQFEKKVELQTEWVQKYPYPNTLNYLVDK